MTTMPPTAASAARLCCTALLLLVTAAAWAEPPPDGRAIMEEVFARHEQFPYTLERQTLILTDAAGNRDARQLRRLSRVEPDGTLKFLLVFDNPPEVRGAALLAERDATGTLRSDMYLPAFGQVLIRATGDTRANRFLGTDFTLEDLTAEPPGDFRYQRRADRDLEGTPSFVIDAVPLDARLARLCGYSRKRHFVRQDIFFVTRTDYFDHRDRLVKRLTRHDLKQMDQRMWRADMVLMEDYRRPHRSLIKTDRRVFSQDYVPAELFSASALLQHKHIPGAEAPKGLDPRAAEPKTGDS
jgi:hypothetical protein